MKLPFGYRIVKQQPTETHLHVTVAVDPKELAEQIRSELLKASRSTPPQTVA